MVKQNLVKEVSIKDLFDILKSNGFYMNAGNISFILSLLTPERESHNCKISPTIEIFYKKKKSLGKFRLNEKERGRVYKSGLLEFSKRGDLESCNTTAIKLYHFKSFPRKKVVVE